MIINKFVSFHIFQLKFLSVCICHCLLIVCLLSKPKGALNVLDNHVHRFYFYSVNTNFCWPSCRELIYVYRFL